MTTSFAMNLLMAVLVVVLFLGAVGIVAWLQERSRARELQARLADRSWLERLIADTSASFASSPSHEIDKRIDEVLQKIGEYLNVDGAVLYYGTTEDRRFSFRNRWMRRVPLLPLEEIERASLAYDMSTIQGSRILRFATTAELPPEAAANRDTFERAGVKSLLLMAVSLEDSPSGALSLYSMGEELQWPDSLIQPLRTITELLVIAAVRQESGIAIARSEALQRAVLASLPALVVVVDQGGAVLETNNVDAAESESGVPAALTRLKAGEPYQRAWQNADPSTGDEQSKLLQLLDQVLEGEMSSAHQEIRFPSEQGERWLNVDLQRLDRPEGGAIIRHEDVSLRKRTELMTARSLDEISHLNRIAALGELASSLAHEINQPLAAILANTESATALLNRPSLDLPELHATLADIYQDALRADKVIRNMRSLLKKGNAQPAWIDLNAMTTDTLRLVRNDALLRNVKLQADLAPGVLMVKADAIQLQQVLLNLLSNAMDALEHVQPGERRVIIRTLPNATNSQVLLEVEDSGRGVPGGLRQKIFDPFYTSKPEGLGVGLSITRSIVESHGGRIWVEDAEKSGAKFRFALPMLREEEFPTA